MDSNDLLSWGDMNSLNAIAGLLHTYGFTQAAKTLSSIQVKASRILHSFEYTDCQEAGKMQYVKTVNVTNTKNVLVQVPGWVVKRWGLDVGNTLEVCYDADNEEIYIRRPLNPDVQGRGETTKRSN